MIAVAVGYCSSGRFWRTILGVVANDSTPKATSEEDVSLSAAEFAEVYEIDTERAITEAKLQRWHDAIEAQHAS